VRADRIPTGTAFVLSGATWLHENLTEKIIEESEPKRVDKNLGIPEFF
jgi:hypothetical protein